MDSLSLSLDEIINKNKKFKTGDKKKPGVKGGKIVKKTTGINKKIITPTRKIGDARLKIIQKNRTKIHDARERIAENARKSIKDARELIKSKKPVIPKKQLVPPKPKIPRSRSAHLRMDEDLLMDDDDMELDVLDKFKTKPILRRTVKNDVYRSSSPPPLRGMPKLPTFSIQNQREVSPTIDPFDCYIVPTRRPVPLPPNSRNLSERYQPGRVMSAHMDAYAKDEPRKSILRASSRSDEHDDRFESDRYVTAEPRSRYPVDESAGIFAKMSSPPRVAPRASSGLIKGYRIIVNNLDTGVTESEMRELFSDIGDVLSAKMIKAGVAEIIYRREGDDLRAHEAYHNRILDGLPMKIMLTGQTAKSASYYRM